MHYAQLRAFHAVARHGGFTRAAKKLHLTQPAVSDQVRKLESHFGVRLFERRKRAVTLTTLGRQLMIITARFFENEQEAIELLSRSQALKTGHIRMAADAAFHVLPLIARFKKRYPGIFVTLKSGNSDWVLSRLFDLETDIGILAGIPAEPELEQLTLRNDPLVAYVALDHPLAGRPHISMEELAKWPMVLREPGSITRALVEDGFGARGLTLNIAMEAQGREAAREAVAAGIGAGMVSEAEFGHDRRLKKLPVPDCALAMTESLVCLESSLHQRTVSAFWEIASGRVPPGSQ